MERRKGRPTAHGGPADRRLQSSFDIQFPTTRRNAILGEMQRTASALDKRRRAAEKTNRAKIIPSVKKLR
jgi:hypothetical protein